MAHICHISVTTGAFDFPAFFTLFESEYESTDSNMHDPRRTFAN